jgi:endonuclease/exonuclease/phosphatase family metal-dependent hydrolase
MRLAAFNVENLFARARALNRDEWVDAPEADPSRWSAGRAALDAYAKLNALLAQPLYADADKAAIIEHLRTLGLERSDDSRLAILRRNRGKLLRRPRDGGPIEVVADGRDDWIGWIELTREPVDEAATRNTARVIREVAADVMVVVEAEDRISLCRFNDQVLPAVGGRPYDHVMLIDGNDARGIDLGLVTRAPFAIERIRSHVDDRDADGTIFSRDCPEYQLATPTGAPLVVLACHLKSKGYGGFARSARRREEQARRTRAIYDRLRREGADHVALAGDFNDVLDSAPLAPLLGEGSDLRDVSAHPAFDDGGRPGTFGNGGAGDKIDHILLSPALFDRITAAGIDRRGVWGGKNGTLWPRLPEITRASEAASDHAAIWVDLDL